MLIQLGAKRETSDDPLDLLAACHGRIRSFLGLAQAICERPLPAPEVQDVAGRVIRYFREAFPLHVLDEDQSLSPRLRGRSPEVDAALTQMSGEHPGLDAQVAELVAVLEPLSQGTLLDDPAKAALRSRLTPLISGMEAHLLAEEQTLFPAARALLSAAEREALRAQMRARRGA
jgi:hemerythrin-like domain-containing protein